uniref:Axonemal dynein light chain domain containing 1 n=1 Tax=Maylandia zebra TaxID=106582 RepID=A0A3P9CSP0_9CICH
QPAVRGQIVPHELLLSLTSTSYGIRRPDAVWHHPLGRKKYKHFLEQPTSLTGAGRDISFLCDAMVTRKKTTLLPPVSEKQVVGGAQVSRLFLCVCIYLFAAVHVSVPGLRERPSGRLEAVQLMGMMDDMLEKAGVDEQSEELGLLELVKVEQNIYNIVFHELIRQVSVGCAERGQLLAKLRQRYQSLLDRIPRRLKALHTEVVAQRALDRRLTEEIHHIKLSIHQLSVELSKIRDHDAFVSHQAEHAHWQLAEALKQTRTDSNVVQAYHQLYELQRARLEAQLIHMTEDRDCWSQFTLCLALKVCEPCWFKCINIIMESTDYWRKQLAAFMSQLKQTEHAHCAQISAIQQGINKWLSFSLLCEHYQGEKQLNCQQTLSELSNIQETWLNMSLQLFRRHPSADGGPPEGRHAQRELDKELCELLRELDVQVDGENGEKMYRACSVTPYLHILLSFECICVKLELTREPHEYGAQAQRLFLGDDLSFGFFESGCFLCYQIRSAHVAQTRWMLELLLLVVPNHSEEENQEEEPHRYIPEISQETLDEDAQMLAEKLDRLSSYITRYQKLL